MAFLNGKEVELRLNTISNPMNEDLEFQNEHGIKFSNNAIIKPDSLGDDIVVSDDIQFASGKGIRFANNSTIMPDSANGITMTDNIYLPGSNHGIKFSNGASIMPSGLGLSITGAVQLGSGTATSATNSAYTCPVFYLKTDKTAIVFFTAPYQTNAGYTLILPTALQGYANAEMGTGFMMNAGTMSPIYIAPFSGQNDRVNIMGENALYAGWNGWFSAWCVLTYS